MSQPMKDFEPRKKNESDAAYEQRREAHFEAVRADTGRGERIDAECEARRAAGEKADDDARKETEARRARWATKDATFAKRADDARAANEKEQALAAVTVRLPDDDRAAQAQGGGDRRTARARPDDRRR